MEPEDVKEYVSSDPQLSAEEKEMGIGFTKKDEKATFFTCISSQIKRALTHTDMDVIELSVFDESDESRWQTTVEDFNGEGTVVALKATVPIESLKINSKPRSARSYGQIISSQKGVDESNFED